MSADPPIIEIAATAAAAGCAGRVMLALHGGERRWIVLIIEAGLGAMLGIIAGAGATYFDPSMREAGWPILFVGGAGGLSGAVGTRVLDIVVAAAQRRCL